MDDVKKLKHIKYNILEPNFERGWSNIVKVLKGADIDEPLNVPRRGKFPNLGKIRDTSNVHQLLIAIKGDAKANGREDLIEYMTFMLNLPSLRKTNKEEFDRVTKDMPKAQFIINKVRKEYIINYTNSKDILDSILDTWIGENVIVVNLPIEYFNPNYTDISGLISSPEDIDEIKSLFKDLDFIKDSAVEDIDNTDNTDNMERIIEKKRVDKEIEDRLKSIYGKDCIKLIKMQEKDKDLILVITENLLCLTYGNDIVSTEEYVYVPKLRMMWCQDLMSYDDFINSSDNVFNGIIYDILDVRNTI